MALKLWRGDQSGHIGVWDWDDSDSAYATSNWVNASGTGVAKPANGDYAKLGTGSQSVTSGFAQGAVTLAGLIRGPGYTGSIGSSGNPLVIGATLVECDGSGGGENWLSIAAGTGEVRIFGGSDIANLLQLAGTVSTCHVAGNVAGTITFAAAMALTTLRIIGTQNAKVTIGSGVTGLTTIDADSGQLTLNSACTTMRLIRNALATVAGSGAITSLYLNGSARCNYNGSGGGTNLYVEGDRSYFDCRANRSLGPVTFANGWLYPGGIMDFRSGLNNMAVTALRNLGGQLLMNDDMAVAA